MREDGLENRTIMEDREVKLIVRGFKIAGINWSKYNLKSEPFGGKVNDKDYAQGNKTKLQQMVRVLEWMERILQSDDSPPPTLMMNQLYGLLIRHARLCILMFYIERGLGADGLLCCDKTDKKDKLLHRVLNAYCGKNSISGEQVQQKAGQVRDLFSMFNGLLKKSRKELSLLFTDDGINKYDFLSSCIRSKSKKRKGTHKDSAIYSREYCLFGMLRCLEHMGYDRSYAPPEESEIRFYQDIRKRATSCLEIMEAKRIWQSTLRKWHSITGEAQCLEPWDCFYRGPSSFGISYAPTGFRLASALDEFPDFLSIVRECKSHFLEINSGLSEEKMKAIAEGVENKESHGSTWYRRKKMKDDNPAVIKENSDKTTREQYLQDILQLFKKVGPLTLDDPLKIQELRLYGQIAEHVTSSFWIYETLVKGITGSDPTTGKSAHDAYDPPGCSMSATEEMITREQCLGKIVQMIEVLRATLFNSPLTEREIAYYKEIEAQLNTDLLNPKFSGLELGAECKGMSTFSPSTPAYQRYLRFVYDSELILLNGVEEDLGEMVRNVFASLMEKPELVDPLKFVEDHFTNYQLRDQAVQMVGDPHLNSPDGLKVLDRLILISTKLETLFDSFLFSLDLVHKHMDSLAAGGGDKEVALEVSNALEVLLMHESSPLSI